MTKAKKNYEKKRIDRKTKRKIRHVVTWALIIVSLLFSIFRFDVVFARTLQAGEDAGLSLVHFLLWYVDMHYAIPTPVKDVPQGMETLLPLTLEELEQLLDAWWSLFRQKENWDAFMRVVEQTLYDVALYLSQASIPIAFVALILFLSYRKVATTPGETPALERWKKHVRKKVFLLIKREAITFGKFVWRKKWYRRALIAIWTYNLNFLTIELEAAAFILYVVASQDYVNILVQIAKLAIDLLVVGGFFPVPVWCVIWYLIFDYIRRRIAKKRREKFYKKGEQFIEQHPGALFFVGRQRSKKTSIATMFKILYERYFRRKLKEHIAHRDKQFPFFNWQTVERCVEKCRKHRRFIVFQHVKQFTATLKKAVDGYNKDKQVHYAVSRAVEILDRYDKKQDEGAFVAEFENLIAVYSRHKTLREFADELKAVLAHRHDESEDGKKFDVFDEMKKAVAEHGKTDYRYIRKYIKKSYFFDMSVLEKYMDDEYPMEYNDGTKLVSIFDAIEKYAQLFFVYNQRTPLDISNYGIREDFKFEDVGNWPVFDGHPFRDPETSKKLSQFGHIINYDWFRPGKVFNEESRSETAIEYGIQMGDEWAKERKNKISRNAGKKKDKEDDEPNQDNDLYDMDNKVRTHVATIDNLTIWAGLFTEQREGSLTADAKDLMTICRIKKTGDCKIMYPLFAGDEAIYYIATAIRDGIHYFLRFYKRAQTFFDYITNVLFQPIFRHYDRIKNQFGYHVVEVKTTDGGDEEVLKDREKIYLLLALVYNDKYATDCERSFYELKHRHAKYSLNDTPQYQSAYPSIADYESQESYHAKDMMSAYSGEE